MTVFEHTLSWLTISYWLMIDWFDWHGRLKYILDYRPKLYCWNVAVRKRGSIPAHSEPRGRRDAVDGSSVIHTVLSLPLLVGRLLTASEATCHKVIVLDLCQGRRFTDVFIPIVRAFQQILPTIDPHLTHRTAFTYSRDWTAQQFLVFPLPC